MKQSLGGREIGGLLVVYIPVAITSKHSPTKVIFLTYHMGSAAFRQLQYDSLLL